MLRFGQALLWSSILLLPAGCVIDGLDNLGSVNGATEDTATDGNDGTDGTDGSDGSTGVVGDVFDPIAACGGLPSCKSQGVCSGLPTPECRDDDEDGTFEWECGYTDEQQPSDETCDNLDNDCDGVTDNVADLPQGQSDVDCGQGVCAQAPARCVAGAWVCDYSQTPDWQGGQESLCDSIDNDCDGETDEGLFADPSDPEVCGWQGVCANAPLVACNSNVPGQALWNCSDENKALALGFSTVELCDGLDNNCNGETDEAVPPDASACKSDGVCNSASVLASCTNGEWSCDYGALGAAYQAEETACDNLDNDCDGQTDEGQLNLSVNDCEDPKIGVGVCLGNSVQPICVNGNVACLFDGVDGFESDESLCDGLDNDCDGQTDETDSVLPPVGQCLSTGACAAGFTAECTLTGWVCTYSSSQYEAAAETTCDNIDNDCDGLTDENIVLDIDACKKDGTTQLEGVCAGQPISAVCVAGSPVCNYAGVASYQEEETLCDNLDNDCDGQTDEGLDDLEVFPPGACKTAGVCNQGVLASCNAGNWICDYALVVGYEDGDETSCDMADNDCDGFIDENITSADSDVCTTGVCATGGEAICIGGDFQCDLANVQGFENPEVSCDGLDNDCDGETDIGTCPALTQCIASASCQDNLECAETPDEDAPRCCVDSGFCPLENCAGQVASGDQICATGLNNGVEVVQVLECGQTGWLDNPTVCETGACVDGECAECAPNTTLCSDGTSIIICDGQGEIDETSFCPVGTTCAAGFPGVCMNHADQRVDDANQGTTAQRPFVLAVGTSATLVAYEQFTQGASPDGRVRALDGLLDTDAFSGVGLIQSVTQIGTTSARDIALGRINGQYALAVWSQGPETSSGPGGGGQGGEDQGDIRARIFDYSTSPPSGISNVASINASDQLPQRFPSIAMFGSSNAVVAWETLSNGINGSGLDIKARRISIQGGVQINTSGIESIANTTTTGEQREPQVVALSGSTAAVAWTSDDQDLVGTSGIYARIFSLNTGGFTSTETRLNQAVAGDQSNLAVWSLSGGGIVGAWQSDHLGDDDIIVRTFDSTLNGTSDEVVVTGNGLGGGAPGIQQNPAVTVTNDGSIVVAWDDPSGEANGGAVFIQQYRGDLTPVGTARLVNGPNAVTGDQTRPALAPARDSANERFWVNVVFEHGNANGVGIPGVWVKPMILAK